MVGHLWRTSAREPGSRLRGQKLWNKDAIAGPEGVGGFAVHLPYISMVCRFVQGIRLGDMSAIERRVHRICAKPNFMLACRCLLWHLHWGSRSEVDTLEALQRCAAVLSSSSVLAVDALAPETLSFHELLRPYGPSIEVERHWLESYKGQCEAVGGAFNAMFTPCSCRLCVFDPSLHRKGMFIGTGHWLLTGCSGCSSLYLLALAPPSAVLSDCTT